MLKLVVVLVVCGCVGAQTTYNVCIPSTKPALCNTLALGDSQVSCVLVQSRVDCAIKLASGDVDFGAFSEEETLLLGQVQPNNHRVVAAIRDLSRNESFAFEAVAIVPASFSGGLQGLKGFSYCHPGLDASDLRWSPRILKEFESAVYRAALERCPANTPPGKTLEEVEVERLADFFTSGCRPGSWSYNTTIDAELKRQHPSLCSLCGSNSSCSSYTIDMGASVSGVDNNNRHVQALQCMNTNTNAVAYVAWQHVREFFTARSAGNLTSYAVLCTDGTTRPLTAELLLSATAPCAFVRQPWSTIVANTNKASAVLASMRAWWPSGSNPGTSGWQNTLYNEVVGGANAILVYEDSLPTPSNYTSTVRAVPSIDSSDLCQPARRWCTLSTAEMAKCSWVRAAAHSLGLQPTIACLQRSNIFECLNDIKDDKADFITSSSNYGYLARDHYGLSPVKLLQNTRNNSTRVAAFVKASLAQTNISGFESLRGKKACFPEYGGIAYVSFVRAAHERSVILSSECDYARAVGEFFDSACAPGALDASHALTSKSSYNATHLCSVCRPAVDTVGNSFTCAWDYSNLYFGTNGSLACLADPATDVAFLKTTDIAARLTQLNLQPSLFRALCRNNSLAVSPGLDIDDGCLLANVIDAEVVTRRIDPLNNALSVLLDALELFFGYNVDGSSQLINLEIFSPFDGTSDLLFKDSALGFTEPSSASTSELARNYIELFRHLDGCNRGAPAFSNRNLYSVVMLVVTAAFTHFIVY